MEIVRSPQEMSKLADSWRAQGLRIGFVPTMGYFHEGHLELMRRARRSADKVAVSLFVNPTQFAPTEDLAAYPRDFDRDRAGAESAGADVMFFPETEAMYPKGSCTFVTVDSNLTRMLCGASRPTHFRGVTTVCAMLFSIVKPHFAVFGEKDFQQLLVIRRMVSDLHLDLQIVPHPIVREPDGVAMSSRNTYLTEPQRKQATCLYRAIGLSRAAFQNGERSAAAMEKTARSEIEKSPLAKIDYVQIRRLPDLEDPTDPMVGGHLLALAVFFGKTRLIDNTVLADSTVEGG